MILAFAAMLVGVQDASSEVTIDDLPAVFAAACLDGSVNLQAGQATRITIDNVPSTLRGRFGKPESARVWQLNNSAPSYLYVLTYKPDPVTSPEICGVASEAMRRDQAIKLLQARLGAVSFEDLHTPSKNIEVLNALDKYSGVAASVGSFTVLELRQLSAQQQRRALREMHWKGLPVPKSPARKSEKK